MMITDYECIDGAVECSTLTSEEAVGCLRYAGIKISIPIFQDGIVQGVFPFAIAIEAGKRNFIISRHKLEAWLADFTGKVVSVEEILKGAKEIAS